MALGIILDVGPEGSDAVGGRVAGPGAGRIVARPRLLARLGGPARVTVVSAPPGSGKTVLLRSWISQADLARDTALVAVGPDDRDPQQFWLSVMGALRRSARGSALVRALTAAPELDGWALVERLLKDLAPLANRVWLVVDDVHDLAPDALRQLELLIMRAPAELRFVLAARHDVRLGLHRLRRIVAVEAWDVPPAWTGQLARGGRLVVPLLIRGLPRSWALDRQDGHLVGRSNLSAFFVSMRGAAGEYRAWSFPVGEAGMSLWGEEPEPAGVDRAALAGVLAAERCEARTGVTLLMDELPMDKLATRPDLWLVTGPDLCWLYAGMDAVERGLVTPMGLIARSGRTDTPALASGGSLAYYGGMHTRRPPSQRVRPEQAPQHYRAVLARPYRLF